MAEADSSRSNPRAALLVGSLTGENNGGTLDGAAAGLEIVGEPEGVVASEAPTPGGLDRPSEEPERTVRLAPSAPGRTPTGELVAEREAPALRLLLLLLL